MAQPSLAKAQIILAPARPEVTETRSVFLAGTTSTATGPDWRERLTAELSHLPITFFNPLRTDWDRSWKEDISFAPFRDQVEWELEMQERATIVVVYFGPSTDAPISLLELGLCARSGKALVACHENYKKRGNVQIVCQKMGIPFLESLETVAATLLERLHMVDTSTSIESRK